jgi:hypothetical protein
MPRIACCLICNKIERLIDAPDGVPLIPARVTWMDGDTEREHIFRDDDGMPVMVPEYDPIMEDFTARHGHGRSDVEGMQFIKVWVTDWHTYHTMDPVMELKKELARQTGEFFEESMYYRDEAVKCYNEHHNPTIETGCIDYLAEEKRLGSSMVPNKYRTYLCHMCPYQQAYVNVELRRRKGWYDPNKAVSLDAAMKRIRKARTGKS